MRRMTGQLLFNFIIWFSFFACFRRADLEFCGGLSGVIDLYWHADVLKR